MQIWLPKNFRFAPLNASSARMEELCDFIVIITVYNELKYLSFVTVETSEADIVFLLAHVPTLQVEQN